MASLRYKVTEVASHVVATLHQATIAADGFIPPFAACTHIFIAGCCLIVAAVKGWTEVRLHCKTFLKCTEVLALFSAHWKGGGRYLQVWRVLTDLLDFT